MGAEDNSIHFTDERRLVAPAKTSQPAWWSNKSTFYRPPRCTIVKRKPNVWYVSIRSSQEHYLPMTDYEELHYPNLMAMKVTVVGSGGCTKPPVRLPAGCVEAAIFAPPSQKSEYDFTLGEWKFEILYCVPITSCLSIRESPF